MASNEPLMTTQEVADWLRFHPATITRMAGEGELPAIRTGGVWRFRRADIEAYLQGGQSQAAPLTRAEEAAETANRG